METGSQVASAMECTGGDASSAAAQRDASVHGAGSAAPVRTDSTPRADGGGGGGVDMDAEGGADSRHCAERADHERDGEGTPHRGAAAGEERPKPQKDMWQYAVENGARRGQPIESAVCSGWGGAGGDARRRGESRVWC